MIKNLYICALIASLGGFLSGYDTGVISGAILFIEKSFNLTSNNIGLLVSCVSLGAVFGAFLNGLIVDKIGRKKTILISAVLFFFGSIFCYFSINIQELIISRTIIGMAVGIVSFACPLYLSEISTKEKRGQIVSFFQISITLGILFSYCSNFLLSSFKNNWQLMLLIGIVPAFLLFIGLLFQKDTPRWLVLNNKIKEAKAILENFNKNSDINKEIEEIKASANNNIKLALNKKLIRPFVIAIGIMFVQIATGINAIIYFTPTIFKQIGFSNDKNALLITIFIGLINFLMTFVAVALVDKLGRKPLLYIGLSGMSINLLILALTFNTTLPVFKYFSIMSCCLYIVFFSMSLGPIALLLISEVFPLKYRGQAMSISIIFNFIFNFIITCIFPILLNKFGGLITFILFFIICIISILFIYFVVPETKNVSLEDFEKNITA